MSTEMLNIIHVGFNLDFGFLTSVYWAFIYNSIPLLLQIILFIAWEKIYTINLNSSI